MTFYRHPVRVDQKTFANLPTGGHLIGAADGPLGSCLMTFQPITFVHAYGLLGSSPQRFGADLQLYLATVNTFLSWHTTTAQPYLALDRVTATDAKRRLSEDLGVALASLFMVTAFNVVWDTIAQIPMNTRLSKKRPDFQAFDSADRRHLFEAKGTTVLAKVEAALHKAIEQVKKYPENAISKLAVVSYLAADERLFPSQTFVVDPPALPDTVPPSSDVARLLHGEKLFEFAGLPRTAAAYVKALAAHLRKETSAVSPFAARDPLLTSTYQQERKSQDVHEFDHGGRTFVGRRVAREGLGGSILFGVARERVESLLLMTPVSNRVGPASEDEAGRVSEFDDDSVVLVSEGR